MATEEEIWATPIDMPPTGKLSPEQKARGFNDLYHSGKRHAAFALAYGADEATIHKFLEGQTMKTVGVMNKKQLESLLKTFPSDAQIFKTDNVATVRAPNGKKVLSAARMKKEWHVMAEERLIDKVEI